jgi:hypothetical protein
VRRAERAGFTVMELIFALVAGGLLVLVLARLADTVTRVDDATRSASDVRVLEWNTERVLRRALEDAGAAMPSAPNLGGVAVRIATRADGTPADTLYVLRGDGAGARVASRGCRTGVPSCIALAGDHRGRFAAGDLIIVGARGPGLMLFQVAAVPALFYAPCGADCPERLVCPVTAGPLQAFRRVVGSVRQPGGTTLPGPCPHAFFPDGTGCEEKEELVPAGSRQEASCRAEGPPGPFTELRVVDRTTTLGLLPPPRALTRGGAVGTPMVRAVRVRMSRFWVRASSTDTVLVRQNGVNGAGAWRAPVVVAGPVRGMSVETLHEGVWRRGAGVAAADLVPDGANPNYAWRATPAASGAEPGAWFVRGHHTIAAVGVRYRFRTATPGYGLPATAEGLLVVATPALLEGGTGDVR